MYSNVLFYCICVLFSFPVRYVTVCVGHRELKVYFTYLTYIAERFFLLTCFLLCSRRQLKVYEVLERHMAKQQHLVQNGDCSIHFITRAYHSLQEKWVLTNV